MTPQDFAFLARVLRLRSGLVLTPDKNHLVESRLGAVARRNGLADLHELIWALRQADGDALLAQVTEAMATEDAVFFRDHTPFDLLTDRIVPAVLRQAMARGTLRIWSAGCGTGQEPYSIAMRLLEMRPKLAGWRVEIMATDLSEPSLKQAAQGRYNQFEVQRGLPIELLLRYFRKTGWHWQIDEAVRAMVQFRHEDLLAPHDTLGAFDIVFCRNVLVYLDAADRGHALERLAAHMRPGAFLVLGAAETAMAACGAFAPVAGLRGIFTREGEGHHAPLRPSSTVVPLHAARAG